MKVRDVMNVKPITCQAADTVAAAARIMREDKVSGMPVLDGERLVGVVSESDILHLLASEEEGTLWLPSPFEIIEVPLRDLIKWERLHSKAEDVSKKNVADVMSRNIHEIGPDDSVEEAASVMTRHRINRLPVVEGGRLVGIITRGDIISGLGTVHEED
jgi:CBS domain-containing protein